MITYDDLKHMIRFHKDKIPFNLDINTCFFAVFISFCTLDRVEMHNTCGNAREVVKIINQEITEGIFLIIIRDLTDLFDLKNQR